MGARQTHIDFFLSRLEAKSQDVYRAFMVAASRITSRIVLTRLADAVATGDIEAVLRLLDLDASSFAPVDEAVRETFSAGAAGASVGMRPNGYGARMLSVFNVRHVEAETWLSNVGAERVTGFLQELRGVVQTTMLDGMQRGANPLTTARELVGTLKKGDTYRKGGTLLLTRQRAGTVQRVKEALLAGDRAGMRAYLSLKGRDRRLDAHVRKALAAGKAVASSEVDKIIGALADKYLKERAEGIARTESLAALNQGKAEAFRQATTKAGIADSLITREWSSTGDKFVRPDHQHLDGQKVTGISTPYRLADGTTIMRPGDMTAGAKQVVNCRCLEYLEVDWFNGGVR